MSIKKRITLRFGIIYFFFLGLAVWLLLEMMILKTFEAGKWKSRSRQAVQSEIIVEPTRGDILDINGHKLATSLPTYRLYMDTRAAGLTSEIFNANIDSLSIRLSRFFRDKSPAAYKRDIQAARRQGDRYFLVNPRRISYTELQTVRSFPLFRLGANRGGFIPQEESRRVQPFGSLASRTIGKLFGDSSKGGMIGLERAYNEELRGTPGVSNLERISGRWVPEIVVAPIDGLDLVTTIDIRTQDVAEHALSEQLKRHDAHHGVAIVMEVETGAIKAMVNLHRKSRGVYVEDYFNYAIGEAAEPGSTFKLASIMVALEDRETRLDDTINTGKGEFRFFDRIMRDNEPEGYGVLTMQQVIEKSSNIGISRLIHETYRDNPKRFIKGLNALRLDEPLGIEITGEAEPLINQPGSPTWSGVSLPWMSIGYEVRLTPLQILAFYNAIANDGKKMKPMFVKGLSRNGRWVERFSTEVLDRSIASRRTIKAAQQMLLGVVERGTATNLNNNLFSIAGKTGTAQIAQGAEGYHTGGIQHLASFVGYFPADNPKYSCIVIVSAPSRNVIFGNVVAGSVFREIAERVFASNHEQFNRSKRNKRDFTTQVYPFSKGGTVEDLNRVFNTLDFPTKKQERLGKWVSTQAVETGITLRPRELPQGQVPSVIGMGAKDAVAILENSGLSVRIQGVGRVTSQSITAGAQVRRGNTIFLRLN